MEYSERVYRLTGLLLDAEENYESIELILDADLAYDVAVTLQDELGKDFFNESEEDDFDYLLKNHDILGITVARYDNKITYFLEEVNYNGLTLESEMDSYYIQDYLLDCLDLDRLHGDKYIIKEFEDSDEEDELEELFEELTCEVLQDVLDNEDCEDFCLHCAIKDAIQEAYEIGFVDGKQDMK
jgi:hypothetical protein